jgi:hypothetical protein
MFHPLRVVTSGPIHVRLADVRAFSHDTKSHCHFEERNAPCTLLFDGRKDVGWESLCGPWSASNEVNPALEDSVGLLLDIRRGKT